MIYLFVPLYHSSQSIHRPSQSIADPSGWWFFGITRRSVNGTALDKQAHEDNECYAH